MKRKVFLKELIIGAYYRFTVNTKYFFMKNILGSYKERAWYKAINRPVSEEEYEKLCGEIYGNKYLQEKYDNKEAQMLHKRWYASLVDRYIGQSVRDVHGGGYPVIIDLGANKGYTMLAFLEKGYDVYGLDIMEDKTAIIDSPDDIVRKHFLLGSVCSLPQFPKKPDIVISTDVFEHIPINKIDKMADDIQSLGARYLVFQISKDVISQGHITLKSTSWWIHKFPDYRLMKELTKDLKRERTVSGELYQYSGVPRNGWNRVPGLIFLERRK